MADERFVVVTVECQHCKTKQKVHVAITTGSAQMRHQMIQCIDCAKYSDVTVPDKIMCGPFPV
jgi:tartrate dehydratase beta subunit/fumarate hydratase class I family protein